jgi:molybdopterin synthase sulfur carrier subunit
MAVKVRIPTPLQKITQNQSEVEVEGTTIDQVLLSLDVKFSGFKERLFDEKGDLRRFINVYLNDEDIRFLDGKNTKVASGDEVSIVPAIAGGN